MTNATGIDVSVYQSTTPSLAGLAFVFVRAGYGSGNPPDAMYATHAANVRAAGLVLGAYWFWYLGQDNAAAVAQFLSVAGDADLLVVDYEGAGAGTTAADAEVSDFIDRVHAAGHRCGLYHSLSGYPHLGQDFDWVAAWNPTPPSIHWDFWQYAGSPLDRDQFAGDAAALAAFVGGDVHYISSAGLKVTSAYLIDIPANTPIVGFDGVQITKTGATTATFAFVGRVDGSSTKCCIRLQTGAYPAGDILAQVTSSAKPYLAPVAPPPVVLGSGTYQVK